MLLYHIYKAGVSKEKRTPVRKFHRRNKTEKTDYGQLEKCYTIFICRDRIPKDEQMSISFYKMVNHKNVGRCHPKEEDYDLMTLVIIRLGDKDYHSEEKSILDFLTIIFQPHQKGFREKLSRYISFEEELGAGEEKHMIGLGLSIYEEGIEQGIKALILDNQEEHIPKSRILEKLQRHFGLPQEKAEQYYKRFAEET